MKITVNSKNKVNKVTVETKPKVSDIIVNKLNVDDANLNDLTDVFINSPAVGDVLAFDGTLWKAQSANQSTLDGGTFS